MLKLLSRVTAPTEGEIDIYGRIASMLEVGTGFHGELTGRENVYMNGAILGMTRAEIDAKMEDIIEFSEVREFIDTPVKRYSSGMYVKLAFSVAAHLDSEIMIMDEVLAVGDLAFQKKCLDKMRDAAEREGRTVLYVSHNMNTIRQLCKRCIVLEKGKIIFDGDVEKAIEVYSHTQGKIQSFYEYTKEYHLNRRSGSSFVIRTLSTRTGEEPVCEYGGRIGIVLHCFSQMEKQQVFFRFEIRFQDQGVVGTMFSDCGIDFRENETRAVCLELDTTHLAPGRYTADIIAYQYNEFGQENFLDGVYPGMLLEISDRINENNKLVWNHRYWGHVVLSSARVVKQEKDECLK
jgi:lipopolysaccharide transport system ATP-binding protein